MKEKEQIENQNHSTGEEDSPKRRRKKRTSKKKWHEKLPRHWQNMPIVQWGVIFLGVFLAVLLTGFVEVIYLTDNIEQSVQNGQLSLSQAMSSITKKQATELTISDFEKADVHWKRAEGYFKQAQANSKFYIKVIGLWRSDIKLLPELINSGLKASLSGQELYAGIKPMLNMTLGKSASRSGIEKRIISPLLASQPVLIDGHSYLKQAIESNINIDRTVLSDKAYLAIEKSKTELKQLGVLYDVVMTAPDILSSFLGMRGSKTYLIVIQNNNELRPTGGLIDAFGRLVVEDGHITDFEYHLTSSPNLTAPNGNCPVENPAWWIQLKEPVWNCWDAHWTADFPTMAKQAKWFYEEQGQAVDGVIAIDRLGVEALLNLLDPVSVSDTGDTVRHEGEIIGLLETLTELIANTPSEQTISIIKTVYTNLLVKHILFYFDTPALAEMTAKLNIDGAINPTDGDYLFVVDSSLSDSVYSSIEESIEYNVIINADGSFTGQVTLDWLFLADSLQNNRFIKQISDRQPEFLNFARVYIPKESVWVGTENNDSPTQFIEERGRLMLGNRLTVALGDDSLIRYHYLGKEAVKQVGRHFYYHLTVQKQPGSSAHSLKVRITLPQGAKLLSTTPKDGSVDSLRKTIVEFDTLLDSDKQFEIIFK